MAAAQILVVEDNEKNMKLFRDVLSATGYRTLEATTGGEAVEYAGEWDLPINRVIYKAFDLYMSRR